MTSMRTRSPITVVAACAAIIILEGYDQTVYGAVLPVFVRDPSWHLSKVNAGYVGSAAYLGMLIGALAASRLSVTVSRRTVLLLCLADFGGFGTACWAAHDGWTLGTLRLLTGIGLGGVLPVTSTLAFSRMGNRHRLVGYSFMFAMIPIGGLIAALLGKGIIPAHGPSIMFVLPAPLIVVALAITWLIVPNSPAWSESSTQRQPIRSVLTGQWRDVTCLLVAATLLALLLWYGLLTWLPGIMSAAGYDLGSALTFQAVLLTGGAVGSVVFSVLHDRAQGHAATIVGLYLVGTIVLLTAIGHPTKPLLLSLVALAGAVAQGGLISLNGLVDRTYPADLRPTALGVTLGFGRVGAIIAPSVLGHIVGHRVTASFTFFALAAAGAGVAVAGAAIAIATKHRGDVPTLAAPSAQTVTS